MRHSLTQIRLFPLTLLLLFLSSALPVWASSKLTRSGAGVDYNLSRYANNNPVNYTDPEGLWPTPDTAWDGFNVGLGVTSLGVNLYSGNFAGAAEDALGITLDIGATLTPGVPGGAGTLLKVKRSGKAAGKVVCGAVEGAVGGVNAVDKAQDLNKVKNFAGRKRPQDMPNPMDRERNARAAGDFKDQARRDKRPARMNDDFGSQQRAATDRRRAGGRSTQDVIDEWEQ